jgi:hypothetical protein
MSKPIGRVTYECRYVIIQVPDEWTTHDPVPPASPDDQWFDHAADFIRALGAPYDHKPINRRPIVEPAPSAEAVAMTAADA